YNRTAARAEALVAMGAKLAATPAEAATGEIVFTMVSDDAALECVSEAIVDNLPEGGLHISMSTVSVALADRLTEAHKAKGHGFVSAPVFGRPAAAAEGKLYITAAGAPADMARALPLLEVLGQTVEVFGEVPSAANLVKLAGNFMIISMTETLGEAMALVAKGGADKGQFLDFFTAGLFNAPIYKNYGAMMVKETFEPAGFGAALAAKDARLAGEAAGNLGVSMPLNDLLRARLGRLVDGGEGHLDLTALSLLASRDAQA
ncbi:MAG: NAD(P)-dependent oxidoreductase, partial [Asticcacaulis sp.]